MTGIGGSEANSVTSFPQVHWMMDEDVLALDCKSITLTYFTFTYADLRFRYTAADKHFFQLDSTLTQTQTRARDRPNIQCGHGDLGF